VSAIGEALQQIKHIDAATRNPWYFPSIAQYSSILESHSFSVKLAEHFNRPTKMEDGELGLKTWLDSFTEPFFYDFTHDEKEEAYSIITARTKADLFQNGSWYIDYKRIRILAVKDET